MRKFIYQLSYAFFFLALVIPTQYQNFRGVVLGILLVATAASAFHGKWAIDKQLLVIGFICVCCSLFFICLGYFSGAPGALNVISVFILWPMVYIFLMGNDLLHTNCVDYIKVIICSSLIVCFIEILVLFEGYGLINIGIMDFFQGNIGIYNGRIELFLMNSATLIYSLPMSICILMMPNQLVELRNHWKIINTINVLLSTLCILMLGRRVMLLVLVAAPVVSLIFFKATKLQIKLSSVWVLMFSSACLTILFLAFYYLDLSIDIIYNDFIQAFGFDSNQDDRRSSGVRGEQFIALMEAWLEQPLFGYGHGAGVATSVRSVDMPWAYELTYVALLFQVGVIGFFVYLFAVLWCFIASIYMVRLNKNTAFLILPTLMGSLSFLIASATNPYLLKFDYLWTVFLPATILNFCLVNKRFIR